MQTIIFFLITLSLFFTFLGGLVDIIDINNNEEDEKNKKNEKRTFLISKEHLWNDGVYLLLLASFLQIYLINKK